MSTTTLKPRPIRKKRTPIVKQMTEQTTTPQTYNKVQSHLPEYQLIDRNALWDDFKNRMKINNYEVSEAMKQLRDVVNHTHKLALPYVDKAVQYVKSTRQ